MFCKLATGDITVIKSKVTCAHIGRKKKLHFPLIPGKAKMIFFLLSVLLCSVYTCACNYVKIGCIPVMHTYMCVYPS